MGEPNTIDTLAILSGTGHYETAICRLLFFRYYTE